MNQSTRQNILWADDQIDLLKPHILFLEEKGYAVEGVANGDDALALIEEKNFDLLLLDEVMPGKSGIETLSEVRKLMPSLPVIMITKSGEESLMNEALGGQVEDFLVKPVNPVQIFSAIKRLFEGRKIQESQMTQRYVSDYRPISMESMDLVDWQRWMEVNRFLVDWDLRLDEFEDSGLEQTHRDLRRDLNMTFGRYVESNYPKWMKAEYPDRPLMSPDIFGDVVQPYIEAGRQVYYIVIDCMRLDQWKVIEDLLTPFFNIQVEDYFAILPTATPYARNSLFAGLWPDEIADQLPQYWLEDPREELSLNRFERQLMQEKLKRCGLGDRKFKYVKVSNISAANELYRQIGSFRQIPFVALVFNFLDILAHGRSQSEILQEIAPDESAFRSLMISWFRHSALFDILKSLARSGALVVLTSDHGSVFCQRSALVQGNRDTSSGIRYKYGDNLGCDPKQTLKVMSPRDWHLPWNRKTKNYIFARENFYFVYPTNFHDYEKRYRGSFQHGGLSLEEMIVPCAILDPKG
ncbi:MAG: bifunctional response regulator/alkaline phosphatase family protein [Candidatus Krumholzibacteria bacterium]|jgi:CheY-like chemotaxis protein|nr:bifunctional response regulator/alkaline phosphatase family protein [Candidatus Krumholzibacteria bacterium]MDP6669730.1 bifunctional response regulator/alkaline phosphatase family protein [Candidatus Krumholzibacteria bacterium]MDP6798054.1 bifunctional response regulator/alkaline phosphatase family protein [Candidatus Krumholzibacteria bacterium]MDP7022488.1 bifunctional response regulator/alkaline phosphatase family protein [Candidatus Krumholzibacteria bacterium]